MNIAIILAGGAGRRFGASIPKQFVEVFGKPVLAYTIEEFEYHLDVDAILVVCVKNYIDKVWEIRDKYGLKKIKWVVEGGNTFQLSVYNGVKFLEDKIDRDDLVLVHFGASPFITGDIISDCIRVCKEKGNAISTTDYFVLSGKKAKMSSVNDPDNYSEEYINREIIAVMNSPHAFKYGFINELYKEAINSGMINSVEPHTTSLMYSMGKKINFALGKQSNIKITNKEDLELFEGYVLKQQRVCKRAHYGDVIVFLAEGFEECEGLLVVDILRRAGIKVVLASIMGKNDVRSSRGVLVQADCLAENVDYDQARMIFLPGGRLGIQNLLSSNLVKEKCKVFEKEKMIAAICAAPSILAQLGLLEGKEATCHPDYVHHMSGAIVTGESVTIDNNIITGQGLGATFGFAFELVKKLVGEEMVHKIKEAICYK